MKKTLLSVTLTSALASTAVISTTASAEGLAGVEGLSGNVGVVSQYFYRGIVQTGTASASAGLDYETGAVSGGVWIADVEDGIEVDLYASYGLELDSGLGLSAGFTSYQYTGGFDTQYNEINLGASYGAFAVDYAQGVWDVKGADNEDYGFLSVSAEAESGLYATVGTFLQDFEGSYVEVGYGTSVGGFDLGVAIINADSTLNAEQEDGAEQSLVLSLGASF